jgi:hypothetical protein
VERKLNVSTSTVKKVCFENILQTKDELDDSADGCVAMEVED